ncbi:OmpA family protein, partial [Alistipes putredinis]
CIGSPVYFFFNLNTAHLTDASQMLNLDELARVAKKYGLSVKVTGAADSSTGTPVLNGSLSTLRADHIVAELEKRGIPIERIVKVSRGGIADHVPVEANRHTKVELFF